MTQQASAIRCSSSRGKRRNGLPWLDTARPPGHNAICLEISIMVVRIIPSTRGRRSLFEERFVSDLAVLSVAFDYADLVSMIATTTAIHQDRLLAAELRRQERAARGVRRAA